MVINDTNIMQGAIKDSADFDGERIRDKKDKGNLKGSKVAKI